MFTADTRHLCEHHFHHVTALLRLLMEMSTEQHWTEARLRFERGGGGGGTSKQVELSPPPPLTLTTVYVGDGMSNYSECIFGVEQKN